MNATPVIIFGISFIFFATVLGAAAVYFYKKYIPSRVEAVIFGFAAGVMLAASVWSLLLPALAQAEKEWGRYAFIPIVIGFLSGGILIVALDKLLSYRKNAIMDGRARRLFLSITLHNIPEGLAVGFAFGAAYAMGTPTSYAVALGLAIGIGIQNLPEGAAVSLPLKNTFGSRRKAFLYGVFSAAAEPIFAVIGFYFSTWLQVLQPWLLDFSAGAMVFVAAEELLPEAKRQGEGAIGSWGAMLGFAVMMLLDVALS